MKHPFLKLFYPKKKKNELERVLFLVFMLFLMKINLKSYLVFSVAILNVAILKDDERGCILI
ncbi:hypothetical protein MPG15_01935 [Helicobacter pylori]|uniref:hypothetical protein n=1 Tax=Helicobacter pylori TaxID=210 RepID=UPI001FD0A12F|nr:hypothetical protein [Helicobacter pylori]UOR67091.1 hypothetical protein MPG15_01935 [Helicobacter pylori]